MKKIVVRLKEQSAGKEEEFDKEYKLELQKILTTLSKEQRENYISKDTVWPAFSNAFNALYSKGDRVDSKKVTAMVKQLKKEIDSAVVMFEKYKGLTEKVNTLATQLEKISSI